MNTHLTVRAAEAVQEFSRAKRDMRSCHVSFTPDAHEPNDMIARGSTFDLKDLESFLRAADVPFEWTNTNLLRFTCV